MKPTWEPGWRPADQPDCGGRGEGKTTEVPENQPLVARGSAETMVISGCLKHTWDMSVTQIQNTHNAHNCLSLVTESLRQFFLKHYLLSPVWSVWQVFAKGRSIVLMCHEFCFSVLSIFKKSENIFKANLLRLIAGRRDDRGLWLNREQNGRLVGY